MPISPYMRDLRAKIGHDVLLQPGVAAVIFDTAGRVLLQRRSDNGEWGLPGGIMEPGEETALEVVPERIVGVYSGPEFVVRYPNGDEAAILSITFACRPVAGEPRVNDDESLEIRYFAPDALPAMPPRHRMRIEDALRNEPRARFR